MPSLGNLFVEIGAKTDGLDKGVIASEGRLKGLTSAMRGSVSAAAVLGTAAAVAGAALVAGLVNSGREVIATQARMAQAMGGTVTGLRTITMAADDFGIAGEVVTDTLTKMNGKLGEAQGKSGAAYDALNRLGLRAEDLAKMDVDVRIAAIGDRIRELGLTSSVAQAELRDLGVRNAELAAFIREGGDAIRDQAQEVRDLGLALSQVDAQKVVKMNEAIGVFDDVLGGVRDKLSVAAAPFIVEISDRFKQAAIDAGGFQSTIQTIIVSTISGFGKVANVIQGLRVVFKGIELVIAGTWATALSLTAGFVSKVSGMFDLVVGGVNSVISAFNQINGTNIPLGSLIEDSGFPQELERMAESARVNVGTVRDELSALAMQEMPGEKVNKFLEDAAARLQNTADLAVKAKQSIATMDGGYASQTKDTADADKISAEKQKQYMADMEAWNQKNANELEAVKQRYMTEQQELINHREEMLVIGEQYDALKFETEAQWRAVKEQAETEHAARLKDITASGYEGIQSIINTHWGKAAAGTAGAMQSIVGTLATGSRKAFEASKAWAIADALISTYQGIAAGVKLGWPLAIPAVAWAAATGFAQVTAIKNQSFGGGGGAAASGAGAAGTAPNPVGVGGSNGSQGSGGGNQTLTVAPINPAAIFSGSAMQAFGEQVYNFSKDGGKVVFSA